MLHLFGWVFIFCFHHPKLTKLSYELVKMKRKKKWCFWVMKTELWWHFCNFTQLMALTFCVLSNPYPLDFPALSSLIIPNFFFFLCSLIFCALHHHLVVFFFFFFFLFFFFCFFCFTLGLGLGSFFSSSFSFFLSFFTFHGLFSSLFSLF